jgi:putative ABC transport system permease protein
MGIPIVAGRSFRSQDTSVEAPGMIISESLAHDLFAGADPIGRSVDFVDFRSFWASLAVVGVVGDTPGTTMRAGGSRAVYLPHLYPRATAASGGPPYPYMPRWETYVVRTGRDLASLLPELRQAVHEVDPRLPMMNIASLDETVAAATAQERFTMRLLLVSAGAALFLAVVGIYGVLAYSVRRRTAEIGVRIALGASPGRVTRLIVWQGAVMSAAGIAAGLGGALLLTRFIASLLYGTSPTDPVTFTATTLLLFGVALAASYLPARRASRIDPAKALRGA